VHHLGGGQTLPPEMITPIRAGGGSRGDARRLSAVGLDDAGGRTRWSTAAQPLGLRLAAQKRTTLRSSVGTGGGGRRPSP
jgi:hypothetical protein